MNPIARPLRFFVVCCFSIAAAPGCQGSTAERPLVERSPNWLSGCEDDGDCQAPMTCRCGACAVACSGDGDCAGVADAQCATTSDDAAKAQCRGEVPSALSGLCLPRCEPGTCQAGQSCVAGACVLSTLPDVTFCAGVSERTDLDQFKEDDLLRLVNDTREAGAFSCGAAAPPLRLDTRLLCAARALASDMAATRVEDLVDSMGRDTVDRLELAGYAAARWSESFAVGAASTDRALELMTEDADLCARFAGTEFTDIAVGSAGDVQVVLLAAR